MLDLYWNDVNADGDYSRGTGWTYDQFGSSPYGNETLPTDAYLHFNGSNGTGTCQNGSYSALNVASLDLGADATVFSIDLSYGFNLGSSSETVIIKLGIPKTKIGGFSVGTITIPSGLWADLYGLEYTTDFAYWKGYIDFNAAFWPTWLSIYGNIDFSDGGSNSYSGIRTFTYNDFPCVDVRQYATLVIRGELYANPSPSYNALIVADQNSTVEQKLMCQGSIIRDYGGFDSLSLPYYIFSSSFTCRFLSGFTPGTWYFSVPLGSWRQGQYIFDNTANYTSFDIHAAAGEMGEDRIVMKGLSSMTPEAALSGSSFDLQPTYVDDVSLLLGEYEHQLREIITDEAKGGGGNCIITIEEKLTAEALRIRTGTTWTDSSGVPIVITGYNSDSPTYLESELNIGDITFSDNTALSRNRIATVKVDALVIDNTNAGLFYIRGKVEVADTFTYEGTGNIDGVDGIDLPTLQKLEVVGEAQILSPVKVTNIDARGGSILRMQKGGAYAPQFEKYVYNSDAPRFSS